jgi:hypothetical protein
MALSNAEYYLSLGGILGTISTAATDIRLGLSEFPRREGIGTLHLRVPQTWLPYSTQNRKARSLRAKSRHFADHDKMSAKYHQRTLLWTERDRTQAEAKAVISPARSRSRMVETSRCSLTAVLTTLAAGPRPRRIAP